MLPTNGDETELDTLSDVLSSMRLRGCVYFQREFCAPWGMDMPAGEVAQFHMVVRGRCWLGSATQLRELTSGDVVVFPTGEGHVLMDDPKTKPTAGRAVLEAQYAGRPLFDEGDTRTLLLCGHFEFDRAFKHPLVKELPALLHVRCLTETQPEWFSALSQFLVQESNQPHPGTATVVNRLAEVFFVQVVREYLSQNPPVSGFLAGIHDRQVNRAIEAVHAKFDSELTLADIAREAGMSRSSLALRFRDVVGETPMEYLTRWRMLKAQELLRSPGFTSLAAIAESVGYKSESAFSHAFKREFGRSPGSFRTPLSVDGQGQPS